MTQITPYKEKYPPTYFMGRWICQQLKMVQDKIAVAIIILMMTMVGCSGGQQASKTQATLMDSLVTTAYSYPNDTTLNIIDSLVTVGKVYEPEADYLRGIVNDNQGHIQIAEKFYAKSYEALKPDRDGWELYLDVCGRLSQIRMTMNDFKGSLEVATKALDGAEHTGKITDDGIISLMWSIALCQYNLSLSEAEETSRQICELLEKNAKAHGWRASPNEVIFSTVLINYQMTQHHYEKADSLLKHAEELLTLCDQPNHKAIKDEYTWRLAMLKVELLENTGKTGQASVLFEKTLPVMKDTPEGLILAAEYLIEKERYAEAADIFARADSILPADNKHAEMNLDNIGCYLIPRLQANLGADRKDSIVSIARRIAKNYNQALRNDRDKNAAELATIYDTQGKEMEIAKQKAELSQQRLWGTGIALVLLLIFFIIYTEYRRRAINRLSEAHVKLQKAYDQLEETTAAKERIESELRIARDIQMSMVPGVFPDREGLDMYAEMTPAKEVGGDLYGYVLQDNLLHFCVGDVSGKGVPASLFMAQSARLFRTLAAESMMPADIAFRMNNALAENNDRGMFVTMFIGLLHLDTCRLDYCNCGHNAPVIDGQFLEMEYTNQPLGLWEDSPFEGETIDDLRGRQMLIYTDGLNEAENEQKELLGSTRLLELMANSTVLDSHQVIDMLNEAVEAHRTGADPNDDLTLMCISLADS